MIEYEPKPATLPVDDSAARWPGEVAHLWTCTTCGALTIDTELHSTWHNTLEARP